MLIIQNKECDGLEFGFIYTVTVVVAILIVFMFEYLEVKGIVKKNPSKYIFVVILIVSILLVPVGLLAGQYEGLGISTIGIYLFVTSLCALLADVLIKRFRRKNI